MIKQVSDIDILNKSRKLPYSLMKTIDRINKDAHFVVQDFRKNIKTITSRPVSVTNLSFTKKC